jgi:hypothetical protein
MVIVRGNAPGAGTVPAPAGFDAVPVGSRRRQAVVLEVTVSAGIIILIVVVLVIVAVAAAVMSTRMRRGSAGRKLAGPEYDRLVDEVGPRKARTEFERRRQRVDGLGIKPLSAERRSAYAGQWDAAQEQFIDNPAGAVSAARSLVSAVATDRGYQVTDHDQLMTDLSVYHGRHLDGYRNARQTTERADRASTEALRRALLGYRELFLDLVASSESDGLGPAREPDMVPAQRPWKQVTQGRHWKTRQQESTDVASTRP